MQNNEMTSPWSNHCWMLAHLEYNYQVAVLALFLSPRTVPNVSTTFRISGWTLRDVNPVFLHLVVSVSSSAWWFKNGNWCLVFVPCNVGPG